MSEDNEDNVINFQDFKLVRDASEALKQMDALFKEAAKYPNDPEAVAFLAEWQGKMAELAAEFEALMRDIEELEKLSE